MAVVHLQTTDGGKTTKTKIFFEQHRDVKAAARLLREALGKDNVTVEFPLNRKGLAKLEAKRQGIHRIVQWSMGGVAAVIFLVVLISLFSGKRDAGQAGAAAVGGGPAPAGQGPAPVGGADPGVAVAAPGGFAVVDMAGDAPALNPEVAKRKAQRQLLKKLADEAPPFDPAQPPTMRSTFAHLLTISGNEHWLDRAERRLRGDPVPDDGQMKYLDQLVSGQGVPPKAAGTKSEKGVWDAIPIDQPTSSFKFNLKTGIPLEGGPGGPFHVGLMNGPLYISYPWWVVARPREYGFDLTRDPKNKNRYIEKIKTPYPAHPVIDLRDGKTVGEFDWRAPVWANARLSPDGRFLVGTDTYTTLSIIMESTVSGWENGKDLLFIWAKGQKKSPTTLKVPGPVDWMEFVSNDRLAFVTYSPKAVLRIHDVAKNQQVAEIELPGVDQAFYPDRQTDDTPVYPGLEFYRPMTKRGAVSANGKYIALGCHDGMRLVSVPDAKVIGLLPITKAKSYRCLNFSADGARLFGFVVALTKYGESCFFRSWSVATGQLLDEADVDRHVAGPIVPGPIEGLYAANRFFFTKNRLELEGLPFRILQLDSDGTALVMGGRAQAPPDTPLCRALQERIKTKQLYRDELEGRKKNDPILFLAKLDWSRSVEKVGPILTLLTPRPEAKPGDRTGIAAQKPQSPDAWTPPSFAPAPALPDEADEPAAMHQFGAWPLSFGDDKAAVIRYFPKLLHRKRWEVWLDILDRTTGKRAAPAAKLWDWTSFPEEKGSTKDDAANPNPGTMGARPLPPIGALRPDAELFALVDPGDARRVDVFKTNGERVLGFIPNGESRIDWVGWSRTHLLTVSGGRFAAWDPASGKALFEVDGGYTYVGEVSPDRKWAALWTGMHADILDAETGKCLGRCQAGGFSGRLLAFTLAPDGKRLAAAFSGWPKDLPAQGPGNTAVVWNLVTGKAGLYGFAGDSDAAVSRRSPAATTCAWAGPEHLLLSGRALTEQATLIDVHLGMTVGNFRIQGGGYVAGQPVIGGPDGRIWYPTNAIVGAPKGFNPNVAHEPDFPNHFVWHTVSLPGLHGKDAFLADPGREWIDLTGQPVQVQAKIGTQDQSEALAKSIARTLQGQGFPIGRGGTVLRVEGAVEDTHEEITFTVGGGAKIPRCALSSQWLSAQQAELWKGKTTATWSMAGSKYKVSEKVVEDFGPAGRTRRYEFNFRGLNPSSAMRDELLLGLARGGGSWLNLPEIQFLRANGQDRQLPVSGTMVVRTPPEVK
jgi:hypothetical protein